MEIVETRGFAADIREYLSETELDALRHLLASKPWVGDPDPDAPGLLDLSWRDEIHITYTVDRRENASTIYLVAAYSQAEDEKATKEQRQQLRSKLDWLKKMGIGIGLKELIEWIKGMF